MPIMTSLPGVPDASEVKPGMAHFAGTGPPGATCGGCLHRGYWRDAAKTKFNPDTNLLEGKRQRSLGCKMFLKLAMQHGPAVNKSWPACKYFEALQKRGKV